MFDLSIRPNSLGIFTECKFSFLKRSYYKDNIFLDLHLQTYFYIYKYAFPFDFEKLKKKT